MAATSSTARRRATARRRTTASRKHPASRVKVPRGGPLHARMAAWAVLRIGVKFADHRDVIRSRKDAAILRATHEGCPTCKGNGQIYTKNKKTGAFTGAKPCPAKPTRETVSRWEINKAARSIEKNTGLIGWSCPCGKKEKPRYRDAKAATAALRTHERAKHGGTTVGGTWYAQTAQPAIPAQAKAQPAVSRVVTNSGMTDQQWEKQNKAMHPAAAEKKGWCWMCAGTGKLHHAFAGQQTVTECPECKGTGKAKAAA